MTMYIRILKAKRTKLEPSRKKDIFVGYRVFHIEIDREEQKASYDDRTILLFTLQIIGKSR
jgi:hypothetical protein